MLRRLTTRVAVAHTPQPLSTFSKAHAAPIAARRLGTALPRAGAVLAALLWSATVAAQPSSPDDPQGGPADGSEQLRHPALEVASLKMGAYFQPAFVAQGNTEFNTNDAEGFEFRNARLTGEGTLPINELLSSSLHFQFDVATGVFLVRDLYGSLHLGDDWVVLDVGQAKAPFLISSMVSEATLQFPTPPMGIHRMAYGRDRGIRLRGQLAPGGVHLGWAGAIQNGEGATVTSNSDSQFLYIGRFEIGPLGNVPLAEPDLANSPFRFVIGSAVGTTRSTSRNTLGLSDVGGEETRFEGDIRLHFRGLSARAEWLRAWMHPKGTTGSFQRSGVAVQAGYVLPLPWKTKFEVVGRFEQSDVNDKEDGLVPIAQGGGQGADDIESLGGRAAGVAFSVPDNAEVRRIEVGANVYIIDHRLKLQASYVLTDYLEGPKTEGGGHPIVGDLFQLQLQFGWI